MYKSVIQRVGGIAELPCGSTFRPGVRLGPNMDTSNDTRGNGHKI